MPKLQLRGPVTWHSHFPDVFYVICEYDNEGIDFTTIDATTDETVAQEQVMAHAFDDAYECAMQELQRRNMNMAKVIYQVRLDCPRYFYKKVDLRKEM